MPYPCGRRTLRRYVPSSTTSTPGAHRERRKFKVSSVAYGDRKGIRTETAPFIGGCFERDRSWLGVAPNTRWVTSLNCRTLAKPDANATSAIGMRVASKSMRAV